MDRGSDSKILGGHEPCRLNRLHIIFTFNIRHRRLVFFPLFSTFPLKKITYCSWSTDEPPTKQRHNGNQASSTSTGLFSSVNLKFERQPQDDSLFPFKSVNAVTSAEHRGTVCCARKKADSSVIKGGFGGSVRACNLFKLFFSRLLFSLRKISHRIQIFGIFLLYGSQFAEARIRETRKAISPRKLESDRPRSSYRFRFQVF